MFVRCIDAKNSRDLLKQEKVYEVVGETEVEYVVVVERNRQVYFRKSRFVLESQQRVTA